jgi:hypothetical protein
LGAGSHTISATYGGSGNYLTASSTLTQTVNKAAASVVTTASPNPSIYGQPVTLTAAVSAASGTPLGTVTFKNGTVTLGVVTLQGGSATMSTSALSAGSHTISAAYSGSGNNLTGSSTLTQTVNKAAASVVTTGSPNPSIYGQPVTLTATVSAASGTPTGRRLVHVRHSGDSGQWLRRGRQPLVRGHRRYRGGRQLFPQPRVGDPRRHNAGQRHTDGVHVERYAERQRQRRRDRQRRQWVIPQSGVLTDIANGNLAQVSWVIPNGASSDHALTTNGNGPSWVASVVNAIGNSPYWANTAIIVTWDDWGGWYDHVAPKVINDGISWGSGYAYGFRVPLIVVSPYAKAAYISHVTHDFGSILKFIETTFNLPSLGYADAPADDLSDCFNLTQTPLPFNTIPALHGAAYFLNDKSPPTDPDDD